MSGRKKGICIDCQKTTCRTKYTRCSRCSSISRRIDKNKDVKTYRREWQMKKKYGINLEEFNVYWIACHGKCFICEKEMSLPRIGRGQLLDVVAIDHDHTTGTVRGLLCNSCNKGLGFFSDSISLLEKAIKYLNYGKKKISNN